MGALWRGSVLLTYSISYPRITRRLVPRRPALPWKKLRLRAEFCCAVRSLSSRISWWIESTHKATPGPLSRLREYWRVDMAVSRWAAKRIWTSVFTCDMRAANLAMMSARLGAEEESPRESQKDSQVLPCCGHRTQFQNDTGTVCPVWVFSSFSCCCCCLHLLLFLKSYGMKKIIKTRMFMCSDLTGRNESKLRESWRWWATDDTARERRML